MKSIECVDEAEAALKATEGVAVEASEAVGRPKGRAVEAGNVGG